MSKRINEEFEVEPFIDMECPYCYNFRSVDAPGFDVDTGQVMIFCDHCHNPIILKMFIPRGYVGNLGMDSGHLPIEEI